MTPTERYRLNRTTIAITRKLHRDLSALKHYYNFNTYDAFITYLLHLSPHIIELLKENE